MTRENKLALVVGFGLILFVGILISDHFSTARQQEAAVLIASRGPLDDARWRQPDLLMLDQAPTPRNTAPAPSDSPEPPAQSIGENREPSPSAPMIGSSSPRSDAPDVERLSLDELRQRFGNSTPARYHVVQPGESLIVICRRYFGSASLVDDLARINGLADPDLVKAGDRLRIPDSPAGLVRDPETTAMPPDSAGAVQTAAPPHATYTVRPGETLSEIAQQQLGSARRWKSLWELNRDVISDPDHVPAGVKIRIPVRSDRRGQR